MLFNSPETASANAEQLVRLNEARKELVRHKMDELEENENEDGKYEQPFRKYIYMTTAPLGIVGLLAVILSTEWICSKQIYSFRLHLLSFLDTKMCCRPLP